MSTSRRSRSARSTPRKAAGSERDFWGKDSAEPPAVPVVRPAADPGALIASLGAPPLPGHEAAAALHFSLVYEKAAGIATALGAASGLLATEDFDDDDDA